MNREATLFHMPNYQAIELNCAKIVQIDGFQCTLGGRWPCSPPAGALCLRVQAGVSEQDPYN
jgi:hypothetical protein